MTTDVQAAGSPSRGPVRDAVARFGAGLIASAVLGALLGLLWGEVAPRAVLQQVAAGEATIMNAETRAFIVADAWFCGIALIAGLITGIAGYRFLIARVGAAGDRDAYLRRAAGAAGLILGALAGALLMMWIGGLIGLSAYQHALATSHPGATYQSSLSLGAKSGLAFWPLITSMMILVAEWSARRDSRSAPEAAPAAEGPFGYPQSAPPAP
ncbi:MAG: hypothetical protein FWE35_12390 [Streptosporangiales bacterium]|nr:hypothetical protein [Streptosporangiales bacterium]